MDNKDFDKLFHLTHKFQNTKKASVAVLGNSSSTPKYFEAIAGDAKSKKASVGLDSLVKASKKLLAISRGDVDPDERDSLRFKRIYGPDDLISERIKLDAGKLKNSVMFKLSKTRSLKNLPSGVFDSYAMGYIIGSPLALPSEEINPLYNMDQQSRITVFGQGGLSSADMVSEEAQNVHPSQFGILDTIAGPECLVYDPSYEVLTEHGFKSIKDISLSDKVGYWKEDDSIMGFINPKEIVLKDYTGEIIGINNGNISQEVTPNHRILITDSNLAPKLQYEVSYAKDILDCVSKEPKFLLSVQRDICNDNLRICREDCYVKQFSGTVWCLKLEGGMFIVRYKSDGIPYWTGNSEKIGVDVRLASMTRLGKDGKLYTLLRDRKTGKKVWMTPDEIEDNTVKFPD